MSSADNTATTQPLLTPASTSQAALAAGSSTPPHGRVNGEASSSRSPESEVPDSLHPLGSSMSLTPGSSDARHFCRLQIDDVGDLEGPSEDTVVQVGICSKLSVAGASILTNYVLTV